MNEYDESWKQYYKKTMARPPSTLLHDTLAQFDAADSAVDLGCGTGIETLYMLEQGWHVFAIDQQKAAIDQLESAVHPAHRQHLQTIIGSFETIEIPSASFIWAGLSLPFCHPSQFESVWSNICAALKPNGRFTGHLFGTNHAWSAAQDMTFHTRAQVDAICAPFDIELLEEVDEERSTVNNGRQQWHMFTITIRK